MNVALIKTFLLPPHAQFTKAIGTFASQSIYQTPPHHCMHDDHIITTYLYFSQCINKANTRTRLGSYKPETESHIWWGPHMLAYTQETRQSQTKMAGRMWRRMGISEPKDNNSPCRPWRRSPPPRAASSGPGPKGWRWRTQRCSPLRWCCSAWGWKV